MGLFSWMLGGRNEPADQADAIESRALDYIVRQTSPRLVCVPNYRERLLPAVRSTIHHVTGWVQALPEPVPATAAQWSEDARVRACFTRPDDMRMALGRSGPLRHLFRQQPGLDSALVLMSMRFERKRVIGMALEGDQVRQDVVQTTVHCGDHRAQLCGADLPALHREIGRGIIDALAMAALGRMGDREARRKELDIERAMIKARMHLINERGTAWSPDSDAPPAEPGEPQRLQARLDENEQEWLAVSANSDLLDGDLEQVAEVFGHPERFFEARRERLRLNRVNVEVAADSSEFADEIELMVFRTATEPDVDRVCLPLRMAASDMPDARTAFAAIEV